MSDNIDVTSTEPPKEQEALNVETPGPLPSLLKKGGLFGKSIAVSPKPSDPVAVGNPVAEDGDAPVAVPGNQSPPEEPNVIEIDDVNDDVIDVTEAKEDEKDGEGTDTDEDDDVSKGDSPALAADIDKIEGDEPKSEDKAEEVDEHKSDENPEVNDSNAASADNDAASAKDEEMPKEDKNEDPVVEQLEEPCVKKVISMDTDNDEAGSKHSEDAVMESTPVPASPIQNAAGTNDGSADEMVAEERETPKPKRGRPPKATPKATPRASKSSRTDAIGNEKEESASPRRSTRTVTAKTETPNTSRRKSSRGEDDTIESGEEEDGEKESKTPVRRNSKNPTTPAAAPKSPRGKRVHQDKADADAGSPTRSSRLASPKKTPVTEKSSPVRSSPRSAVKSTPQPAKSPRGRQSSIKGDETEEEELPEEKEKKSASKGRPPPASSSKKGRKSGDDDPYDLDTSIDKHADPLSNITVKKGSFGEVSYTRTPSTPSDATSKYANTERQAESRIATLSSTPTVGMSSKTSAVQPKSRGRPPKVSADDDEVADSVQKRQSIASSGRKRKAEDTLMLAKEAKLEIPKLDADAQWSADHPEDEHAPLVPGARVFAAYGKTLYPALVGERDGLGRYHVRFVEDDVVRPVPPAGVIPLAALTSGKECLATDEVLEWKNVKVFSTPNASNAVEWLKGIFTLQNEDKSNFDMTWNQLSLEMQSADWKDFVRTKSRLATTVQTDNIASVADRRERRARHETPGKGLHATPVARTPRPPPSARKTPQHKEDVPAPPSAGRRRKSKGHHEMDNRPLTPEDDDHMEVDEKSVGTDEEDSGGNRIFLNKHFVLTSANRSGDMLAFKKNEMKKSIQERGGIVVDDISIVPLKADAYLISDTHYRTHKYLAAMARGMPCVSHQWIAECVSNEHLLDYTPHLLSAGVGLLDGKLYPLRNEKGVLLKGMRFTVHSVAPGGDDRKQSMSFKQIWEPICAQLGATLVDEDEACGGRKPDVFLTDSTADKTLTTAMKAKSVPIVSSEWLIQAIITGVKLPFNAHARFTHDSNTGDR